MVMLCIAGVVVCCSLFCWCCCSSGCLLKLFVFLVSLAVGVAIVAAAVVAAAGFVVGVVIIVAAIALAGVKDSLDCSETIVELFLVFVSFFLQRFSLRALVRGASHVTRKGA